LRQPLADLGIGGVVAFDQLDPDPRRQVPFVQLDVEVDAFLHLIRRLGDKAGIAVDHPDFDGLRISRRHAQRQEQRRRDNRKAPPQSIAQQHLALHHLPPASSPVAANSALPR
jgi:hypothetical protein